MAASTPRFIAVRTALLISLFVLLVSSLLGFVLNDDFSFLIPSLLALATFIASYFFIVYAVENFIYEKVKIIYKTIHRLKQPKSASKGKSKGEDVLEEVKKDVLYWAEDKVKEIQKLRKKDSFRREFIGNVAHELKTPVFNIQGYVLTLLEGALEDPDNNRKFLEKAARSVDRMVMLLEDLDEITKIESGNFKLETEEFDIVELCRESIESLEHKAKKHDINLRLKNPNERPIMVIAERSQIEQVLTNLLVNSINYGKKGGETMIRFYNMEENILVEVADDGPGIAKEHLPRIFERFYRVDKSRSRNEGGSGLGLSIVKHIIEAHGQAINVRATPDRGATFSFTLKHVRS
jgi:two-component system phosphate regulon sensor histidine kinase PhoR